MNPLMKAALHIVFSTNTFIKENEAVDGIKVIFIHLLLL